MSSVGADGTADLVPPEALVSLVQANWPWSEWANALGISLAESGWDADAVYDTTGPGQPCGSAIGIRNGVRVTAELSVGYYAINLCNYPADRWDELRTPAGNVAEAARLWRDRSWQPWYFSALRLGLL